MGNSEYSLLPLCFLLPLTRSVLNLKFCHLILETDPVFGHVDKCNLFSWFDEDQLTKKNREGDTAKFW